LPNLKVNERPKMNDKALEWLSKQPEGKRFRHLQVEKAMSTIAELAKVASRVRVVFTPEYGRDGDDLHVMYRFDLWHVPDVHPFRCLLSIDSFRESFPMVVCLPGEEDFLEVASSAELKAVVAVLLRGQVRKHLEEQVRQLEALGNPLPS